MPKVNNSPDEYANQRIGIFFPGYPNSLTGQCVSLIKWYLAEMTSVPNPQAARGNAKDYGDNLVNEGQAKVTSSPIPGDIVVWKQDGGGYGHIAILLSGNRVFEENVGLAGAPSAVYEGNKVYASRIDPLNQSWRKGSPTFYHILSNSDNNKTNDNGDDMPIQDADNYFGRIGKGMNMIRGRDISGGGFSREEFKTSFVGRTDLNATEIMEDDPEAEQAHEWMRTGFVATRDNWSQQINTLQSQNKDKDQVLADNAAEIEMLKSKLEESEKIPVVTPPVESTPSEPVKSEDSWFVRLLKSLKIIS